MADSTIERIPIGEYQKRVRRVQEEMRAANLDALIAFGHSAQPEYLRYLADFRVAFETGGVAVPARGEAELLVGPESLERALMSNPLSGARKMSAFREIAAPAYEDPSGYTFEALFLRYQQLRPLRRVGIAGWRMIPMDVFSQLQAALKMVAPNAQIVAADKVVDRVRAQKSDNELLLIRQSARVARQTLQYVIAHLRAGMTGDEVRGMALAKMIELGAEGEAFPMWITRQEQTECAISVPCKEKICKGDLVQLQIGASVGGYCSACARPVSMGKADAAARALIESCILAKRTVEGALAAARTSGEVARAHREQLAKQGHEDYLVYGPCHGVGLAECEAPWIECATDFPLEPGMAFCVDIFLRDRGMHRGVRFEDMVLVAQGGIERLTQMPDTLIELECER